jgi:DNA polymerase-4
MAIGRAALRCPKGQFLSADHEAYQDVQQRVDAALRQFTDRVETAGLGSFFLDVSRLQRRYPEDKALAAAILVATREECDLDLQIGLAERRFTAKQAARAAKSNGILVVSSKRDRTFLAPLPLEVLPAEEETVRRLNLLGLTTLGELSKLPRPALIRQFGPQAGFLHDLASGCDPRPVHPDAPPLELRHAHTFEYPAHNRDILLNVGGQLAASLAETLYKRGYQAQGLRLSLTDEVERLQTTTTSVEPPTSDRGRIERLVRTLIERIHVQAPVSRLDIVVYPLRPAYLGATQLALFSGPRDQRLQRLQEALRRLRARFGEVIIMVASLIRPPTPRPIQVTTNKDNIPLAIIWDDRIYKVRYIYEHWRERRYWWARTVARNYYRLEDISGQVRLIYQDRLTSQWWLERRKIIP